MLPAASPPQVIPPMPSAVDIYAKLREYIARSGKTQRQVSDEAGIPRPSYLSHMVNGRVNWVEGEYFKPLADALHLTVEEIRELKPEIIWETPDPLTSIGADPLAQGYPIPMLGDVAAGGRMDAFIPVDSADEWIDAGQRLAQRYGLGSLYALKVTGDSMYSERTRFSVPDNSVVVVNRDLEPVRGDIVVAYIEELDLGVIKSYGEPADAALSSYNPTGPVYRASQYHIKLCGVVVEIRTVPLTRRNGYH